MMKKIAMILLLCLLGAVLAGCSSSVSEEPAPAVTPEPLTVDLDLSGLSGTVVYSQVYNILSEPEPYMGKVIRMAGYYSFYEDKERGVVYHACVIPDATACCAQGIEFVWAGEHAWPADYPKVGEDIIVTGRFSSYDEDGITYFNLIDAEMVPAEKENP